MGNRPTGFDLDKWRWYLVKRARSRLLKRGLNGFFARQSLVPDRAVFDARDFPALAALQRDWKVVRDELEPILRVDVPLPRVYELQKDNYRISADGNWTTFILYGWCYRVDWACELCPETTRLVEQIPGLVSAYFSVLSPGARIPRHKGLTSGLIRCHLPLMVPAQRERCAIDIDGTRHAWEEGQLFVFDDTRPHEVHNDTDQRRVVLLLDFERPMRLPARWISRLVNAIVRRTRFVQEARKVHAEWGERFSALAGPRAVPDRSHLEHS